MNTTKVIQWREHGDDCETCRYIEDIACSSVYHGDWLLQAPACNKKAGVLNMYYKQALQAGVPNSVYTIHAGRWEIYIAISMHRHKIAYHRQYTLPVYKLTSMHQLSKTVSLPMCTIHVYPILNPA